MEVLLPYHIFIVFGWPFAPLALPDRRYPKQSLTWKPKSPWSQTQNGSAWQHFQQVWLSMTLLTLHSLIVFIISLHLGCLCPRAPESSRLSSTIHSFGIFQLGTFLESVILTKSIEIVFCYIAKASGLLRLHRRRRMHHLALSLTHLSLRKQRSLLVILK